MADKKDAGFSGSYLKLPKGIKLYRPKEGKALLDVIPFMAGKGNPHAEEGRVHWERTFYVHRNIGPSQEAVICPARTLNKPCPVCEHRASLTSDDDDKERKDLMPKERQLILLQDRKSDRDELMLSDASSFAFGDEIIDAVRSVEGEEGESFDLFFTLEEGKTLRVVWGEERIGKGRSFMKATRIDFKDREPLDESLLDDAPCLDDLLVLLTYDELKKKFMAVGKKKDEDDEDDDEPKGKRRASKKDEDDEDEDEAPKGRRRSSKDDDEDEEDEKPKRGSSKEDDDDDEDEKPKGGRKKKDDEDDDEWEEWNSKDKKDDEDEDDEDEDEKPKRRSSKDADDDDDDEDEGKSKDGKSSRGSSEKKRSSKEEDDDEDDDEPKGKDDEDDEDEDEDEKPRGKRRAKKDDDED